MQIFDILNQTGGLQSVARDLGISEEQASNGAAALLPAILGGFRKQAQTGSGPGGLGDLLGQLGGGSLLDQVLAPERTNPAPGNDVLGQIFGSKDVSRTVAQSAATQSGLDPALLRKMLPMLAMLVGGFLAKQGGGAAPAQTREGGLAGMLGGLLGGGGGNAGSGLGALLDQNGDGNALDDILRMAGRALR